MESGSPVPREEEILHQKALLEDMIPFRIAMEFEALMKCPWYIPSYVTIADSYMEIFGYTTARQCYELVVALDPSSSEEMVPKIKLAAEREKERDEEERAYYEAAENEEEDAESLGGEDGASAASSDTVSEDMENLTLEEGQEEVPVEKKAVISDKVEEAPAQVFCYDVTEEIEAMLKNTPPAPPNVMSVLRMLLSCKEGVWVPWTAAPRHKEVDSEKYFKELCGDNPVSIVDTTEMGRGMLLLRDVKADEIIFEEDPFVMGMGRFDRCAYCVNELPDPPIKCEKCDEVYCSEECRKKAKDEWHEYLCGRDTKRFVSKANEPMIMIAKLIAYSKQHMDGAIPLEISHIQHLASIFHFDFLNDDTEEVRKYYEDEVDFGFHGLYQEYLQVCYYTNLFHTDILSFEVYTRLTHIINTNSLEISTDPDDPGRYIENTGSGVFILYSHINHSCASTVYCCPEEVNYSSKLKLRAAHDLKAGQQLRVSYLDSETPKSTRQYNLYHYGFLCNCEMCENEIECADDVAEAAQEEEEDDGYETVEETVEYVYEEDLPEEWKKGDGEIEEIVEYIYMDGEELEEGEEYEEEVVEEVVEYYQVTSPGPKPTTPVPKHRPPKPQKKDVVDN